MRKSEGSYDCEPKAVSQTLLQAARKINAAVAFTMSTETIDIVLDTLLPHQAELRLSNGHLLQVIPSLSDLATSPVSNVKIFQYAALIQQERILLLWHDSAAEILNNASLMEERLMSLVVYSPSPIWISLTLPNLRC